MMSDLRSAVYARVSSEHQATAQTIASQSAAPRERVAADGLRLHDDLVFIDDGYSGASLVRPALERLRDAATAGEVERLYVQSPDRLARRYAYQVLLVDELQRAGVELVFLNRAVGQTPEDELLLQVQGIVAEWLHRMGPELKPSKTRVVHTLAGSSGSTGAWRRASGTSRSRTGRGCQDTARRSSNGTRGWRGDAAPSTAIGSTGRPGWGATPNCRDG
jgi:predicted site-specific integrase-resolvase